MCQLYQYKKKKSKYIYIYIYTNTLFQHTAYLANWFRHVQASSLLFSLVPGNPPSPYLCFRVCRWLRPGGVCAKGPGPGPSPLSAVSGNWSNQWLWKTTSRMARCSRLLGPVPAGPVTKSLAPEGRSSGRKWPRKHVPKQRMSKSKGDD